MIISCDQCLKKFEIDSNLIPNKGRLLQCSSCNHKWFYKKEMEQKTIPTSKPQEINEKVDKAETIVKTKNVINDSNNINSSKKIKRKHLYNHTENKKINSLNFILVAIISIAAIIILLDTFKNPFSLIFPEIEFILESLYETLKDITLFIQDLF